MHFNIASVLLKNVYCISYYTTIIRYRELSVNQNAGVVKIQHGTPGGTRTLNTLLLREVRLPDCATGVLIGVKDQTCTG